MWSSGGFWPQNGAVVPAAGGGGIVVQGTRGSDVVGGGAKIYLPVGFNSSDIGTPVEVDIQYRTTKTGNFQKLRGRLTLNSLNGPTPVTLRINGVGTALTFSIPPASIADFQVDVPVPVADGDLISVEVDPSASTGGTLQNLIISYE